MSSYIVQSDAPNRTEALGRIAEAAGCTDDCRLLAGWSIRDIAVRVWHGQAALKAEIGLPTGDVVDWHDQLVAWVKSMHEAGKPFDGE